MQAGHNSKYRKTYLNLLSYDFGFYPNYTLETCEDLCLQTCDCKGFQFKFIKHDYPGNIPYCFTKTALLNGHIWPNFEGDLYLKVPNSSSTPTLSRRYAEKLKKATRDFCEEIGRGGGGIVYKGIISDGRVAAIKQLNQAIQGEAEFRAEMRGYCAGAKHRLLVYNYMEHGSSAEKLSSDVLDCEKRIDIASQVESSSSRARGTRGYMAPEWVLNLPI
ncbi:hypothetical protein Peur_065577 [Populus x canadensis]